MKDPIERQDAIDVVMQYCPDDDRSCSKANRDIRELLDDIENLPSAQPEQRWIPCSERLPEEGYVLISKKPKKCFDGGRCVTIAIRMEDPRSRKVNWRDIGFGVIPDDNVLAWMPLPEPWKGESEICGDSCE